MPLNPAANALPAASARCGGVEVIDRIKAGENSVKNKELLLELCDTMVTGSLCAMGGLTPYPVRSALEHFAEDFESGS